VRLRSTINVIWPLWLIWTLGLSSSVAGAQDSGVAVVAPDQPARVAKTSGRVPLLGQPAPPLPWIDVIGVEGASAAQRVETLNRMTEGNVVFLDFWATWCGWCVKSMPHGLRLAQRETSGSLTVVFATYLDQRNTKEDLHAFVEHGYSDRYGIEFDGIVAMLDDRKAYLKWQRGGIPRYAVVDRKGIVRYEGTGAGAAAPAVTAAEALVAGRPQAVDQGRVAPVSVPPGVTIEQRLDDAERATDKGRLDEAEALYRAILAEDPDHDYAYELLWQLSRGRTLDKTSRPYEHARRLLPDTFKERTTRHYIIFSDADPTWVREQGELLERTHDQFIRFATRLGLRPLPITHKLVAIAFENQKQFNSIAGRDGVPWPGFIAGYYSPSEDRLVFYHAESNANIAQGRRELEEMLDEIEAIRWASRRARLVGRRDDAREIAKGLDKRVDTFNDREQRLNLLARQRSISVTVHEAVHQLMFHTRVQAPGVHQPRWLTEGLAVAFETDAPKSRFGPAHEYEPRRQAFWQLLDDDKLLPLRKLVTSKKTSGAEYSQSYALVTWMCRYRRPELRDYMRRLNALPPGSVSPKTHLAVFEDSFGDIERLEQRWLKFERRTD